MSLTTKLHAALSGATKIAVLGVGSEFYPNYDDLGLKTAKLIQRKRIKNVVVLIAKTAPENFTAMLRRIQPSHVVLIDSAEMGLQPGGIELVDADKIKSSGTTHALSPSLLCRYIETTIGAKTIFIGIQPGKSQTDYTTVENAIEVFVNAFRMVCRKMNNFAILQHNENV